MPNAETAARAILERAGFDLHDIPGASKLAKACLGAKAITRMPPQSMHGAEGEICRVGVEGHRIYLSSRLSPERAAFVTCHELAHWYFGPLEHGSPEIEALCDATAAALLCPRGAFRAAVAQHGEGAWEQLALDFATDVTCVALRYGEVLDVPLVLVAPGSVRVRGAEYGWPVREEQLRRLARTSAPPPGVVSERLPDDRRRVLLRAAG